MANRLDRLYAKYASSGSNADLDALTRHLVSRTWTMTGDADMVQDVMLVITEALPTFKPKHDDALQNFHSRVCKHRRLARHKAVIAEGKEDSTSSIEIIIPEDDAPHRDYGRFSADELKIVRLLEAGYSRTEIPRMLGMSTAAMERMIAAMKGRR